MFFEYSPMVRSEEKCPMRAGIDNRHFTHFFGSAYALSTNDCTLT